MSAPLEPAIPPRRALRLHRELTAIWATGKGLQRLASVNHSVIGLRIMITAFVFMLIGGLLAGIGLAMWLEYTNQTIRDEQDLPSSARVVYLGDLRMRRKWS